MHRSWVGKRVCQSADRVRENAVMVVDSLWTDDGDLNTSDVVQQISTNLKELDAAVKDWEQIQQVVEDTTPVMQERHMCSENCKQVVGQLGNDFDLLFPENGSHRKLKAIAHTRVGGIKTELGPFTQQILTRLMIQEDRPATMRKPATSGATSVLASTTEAGFSWNFQQRRLVLRWARLMCVTLRMNNAMEICSVHIFAQDGVDTWPSKFDVFRSMEREARRELRQLKFKCEYITQDEVNSRFIMWVSRYRMVFQSKCGLTKKHFALGGVGRDGQLEARPPLVNRLDEDEGRVVFQSGLI